MAIAFCKPTCHSVTQGEGTNTIVTATGLKSQLKWWPGQLISRHHNPQTSQVCCSINTDEPQGTALTIHCMDNKLSIATKKNMGPSKPETHLISSQSELDAAVECELYGPYPNLLNAVSSRQNDFQTRKVLPF